ncbi:hypothetical protein SFRURICE_015634, partial [Spodoptera frugiperda]
CHSHSKYESNDSYQAEIHRVVQARDVTLTINTNLTRPLKPNSIKPATNGCASRNKIGALGEVRFKTVALRGIPHRDSPQPGT